MDNSTTNNVPKLELNDGAGALQTSIKAPLAEQEMTNSTARLMSPRKPLLDDYRQDSIEIPAVSLVPVPPDGGWGWVIVFASFMANMVVDGISYSYGIFLPEFIGSLGGGVGAGALVGSLLSGCYLLVGPIVSGLVNRFEARPVMIAGAIIASFAFFISYWAHSIYWLMLTFGIMGGVGFGLIYLPAIVYVGYYFEKKRALATGLSVAGSGFGTFVFPPLSVALITAFTWRGALWILSGIILNCAVFGCLMRSLPKPKVAEETKKHLEAALSQASNLHLSDWTLNNFKDGAVRPRKLTLTTTENSVYSQGSGFQSPLFSTGRSAADGPDSDRIGRARSGLSESSDGFGTTASIQPAAPLEALREDPAAELTEDITANKQNQNGPTTSENDENVNPSDENAILSDEQKSSPNTTPVPIEGPARKPELFQSTRERGASLRSTSPTPSPQRLMPEPISSSAAPTPDHKISLISSPPTIVGGVDIRPQMSRMVSRASRLSVRDFAWSVNRLNSMSNSTLTVANSSQQINLSGVDPAEFSKPFARQDIFLTGNIRKTSEFKQSGMNLASYRESIVSIPRAVEVYEGDYGVVVVPGVDEPSACDWIPSPVRHVCNQMVDVNLLKNPTMVLLCISNFLGFIAFYVPFVYLTLHAASMGIDSKDASFFLSVIGITNTAGRVFYGWLSDRGWVRPITINNVTLILCGILTLFVPLMTSYVLLMIYSAVFGFLIAAFICLTSIILVDHLGLNRLTNAFGLLILVRGIACLIGSPLAGFIFTLTSTYDASFIFSGVIIVLSGVVSCGVVVVEKFCAGKTNIDQDNWCDEDEFGNRKLDDIMEGLAEQESPVRSISVQYQSSPA